MIHISMMNDETGETLTYSGLAVVCILANVDPDGKDKLATIVNGISPGMTIALLSDVLSARVHDYVLAKTEAEISERTANAAKPHIKRSDA